MSVTSPVAEGLLMTHKIITRGLNVSIRKCDEYIGNHFIPPDEIKGFAMYVETLKRVTHSHHLTEDNIAFPYFRGQISAPYKRLKDDHVIISRLLDSLDERLVKMNDGELENLRDILVEFEMMWVNHIRIEEENFSDENIHRVAGLDEQITLTRQLAGYGSKHVGRGQLALAFYFYNLDGKDREAFMMPFPWLVKKFLVPVVWKNQWKPMSPFLL
jgi:hemerythrin-like domain-containing protein